MARSLNRVQLIGNLTRDPELRYTPTGTAVCSFGLATNRNWTTDTGEKKDEVEFHKIVAWNKLAELCSQFLTKGRKVYVEGRLSTRSWQGQDGAQKSSTEIVISEMIILDSKRTEHESVEMPAVVENSDEPKKTETKSTTKVQKKSEEKKEAPLPQANSDDIMPDDIPF